MAADGVEVSIYLRKNICSKIDRLVSKDTDRWKSRSQFINSAIYRFLREPKEVPLGEKQTCRIS